MAYRRRKSDCPECRVAAAETKWQEQVAATVAEAQNRVEHAEAGFADARACSEALRHELAVGLQDLGEGPALDVLHHDEVRAVVRAGVVDVHDTGVVHPRRSLRLAPEPRDEGLVPRVVRGEDLDRDGSAEDAIGPAVHGGHPAAAELLLELVAAAQDPPAVAQSCPLW